ncbi:unnamed protein product [Colias eurytheme]|nr:unnamed protein product [Colias eurytheme]
MEKSMELLWSRLDEKLNQQVTLITESVTQNIMFAIDERIRTITEENIELKSKISKLELKLNAIEKDKRKCNLVFFGIDEFGKSEAELVDYIKETIIDSGTHLDSQEISNIYRIGKRTNNKNRPIVVTVTSTWKKHLILKNKARLPQGIYVKEDFSKETLEKRKLLQPQVEEERKKGNIAFIKYDKLIVKKPLDQARDKRKREASGSPKSIQKKLNTKVTAYTTATNSKGAAKENIIKPTILNFIERPRSASLSEIPKNL